MPKGHVDALQDYFEIGLVFSYGSWIGIVQVPKESHDRPSIEIFRTWERHPSPEGALKNCLYWINQQIEIAKAVAEGR